jgi:hypothetical protein
MSRSTKHSDKQKEEALALAEEVTIREAAERTGVPAGTIKRWRFENRAEPKKNQKKKKRTTLAAGANTKKNTDTSKNLKPPWKPGQSGNPSGRPKVAKEFRERCQEFMNEEGFDRLIKVARSAVDDDRFRAIRLITEYAYGKPIQAIEHGGSVEKRHVYEITQRLIKDTEALDLADQLLQRSRAIPSINTGKPGGNGHRG